MKRTRALAVFLATLAVGAVGATLTLVYASRASGLRTHLRRVYDGLETPRRQDTQTTRADSTKTRERAAEQTERAHAEHALEHGAAGRAHGEERSHKPHVRP